MSAEMPKLSDWVGATEHRRDHITAVPVAALAATLDRDEVLPAMGDPLAALRHWLYFLSLSRQSELGPDGHARRGGFLPPVPLPWRMWAGGRLEFRRPLHIGDAAERTSRVIRIEQKTGRAGPLVFVLVRHEISVDGALAIVEEHDIVFRDHPRHEKPPTPGGKAPADATFSRDVAPDAVLLFRYSALTFNGHRIHYDRRYVSEVEGYPGLVVQGPLIATLLVDLARDHLADDYSADGYRAGDHHAGHHRAGNNRAGNKRAGDHRAGDHRAGDHRAGDHRAGDNNDAPAAFATFTFRAVRPLFDTGAMRVCGRREPDGKVLRLWAQDADGHLAMEAAATLR